MTINKKPIIAFFSGALGLLCANVQTVQAQLTPGGPGISGSSLLTTKSSVAPNEQITVGWSIKESASDVYTYDYTVYNPNGDVLIADGTTPETVDSFDLDFTTSAVLAEISGSPTDNGNYLAYTLGPVSPGDSSSLLSFTSTAGPSAGSASASDQNPPSPWAGSGIPVPGTGNFVVPDGTSTMGLLAGVLALLPVGSTIKNRVKASR